MSFKCTLFGHQFKEVSRERRGNIEQVKRRCLACGVRSNYEIEYG